MAYLSMEKILEKRNGKTDMANEMMNTGKRKDVPKHIAIILDGNGRWAKKRGLPRTAGHAVGSENFRKIALYCRDIGVDYLTVYAFSTENWKRPQDEVKTIMRIRKAFRLETPAAELLSAAEHTPYILTDKLTAIVAKKIIDQEQLEKWVEIRF